MPKFHSDLKSADESYCRPCLEKGHQCMTTNQVNGRHVCVFCEDGVPCPCPQRERETRQLYPKAPAKPEPAPRELPLKSKVSIAMEKAKCRYPGCEARIRANTKSGCCTPHWYWSTKNPAGGSASATAKPGGGKRGRKAKKQPESTPPPITEGDQRRSWRGHHLRHGSAA